MNFIPFEYIGSFRLDDDASKYSNILSQYKRKTSDEYGNTYYYSPEYEAYYKGHYVMITEKKNMCCILLW